MSNPWPAIVSATALAMGLALSGCKSSSVEIPEIPEQPTSEQVHRQDFVETAPGYGIYSSESFQVNLEAEDAPAVKPGEKAIVVSIPGGIPIDCHVSRVLRSVTAETHQGIAWLRPDNPNSAAKTFRDGDFVFATITTGVKHGALAIPRAGVFIKDSKTWAIAQTTDSNGKAQYLPVEIQTGLASGGLVEVVHGLTDGQTVAVGGAIGFLYPDFKASADD